MKDIFKQIMIEFREEAIPQPIPRDIQLPSLKSNVRKAFVYIGMRRSGKIWALYQRMHELMASGVDKSQLLYINFEDDRLNEVDSADFQSILEAYWELYPEHIDSNHVYFFFDEIAETNGWEQFIRRLLDKEKMHIYLSGSSAKLLSREIATNLRGRTITREIFPLDFKEYLHSKKISINSEQLLSAKQQSKFKSNLMHYLRYGGFPEVLDATPFLHREILQSYIDSVIFRDIIERYDIKNHTALRQFLFYCLQNATGLLSINKLYNQFKSRGISVSKDSLYEYMNYFEDAYCLFSVSIYSFSLNKTNLKPKKVYPIDAGLIAAYSIQKQDYDSTALLETTVFLGLRRDVKDIYYYHSKAGLEVDFLSVDLNGAMSLYQAAYSIKDEKTKQHEVTALLQAMSELSLTSGTIVTLEENETIIIEKKTIYVVPLYVFLMKSKR